MRYQSINNQLFIQNRKHFCKKMASNALAVFNSNDIMPTNADGTMPFRQNNDLFYLTGIDQEETILVLFPSAKNTAQKEICNSGKCYTRHKSPKGYTGYIVT